MHFKSFFVFALSMISYHSAYAWQWPWQLDLSGIYALQSPCEYVQKELYERNKIGIGNLVEKSYFHSESLPMPIFTKDGNVELEKVNGGFKIQQINQNHISVKLKFSEDISVQYKEFSKTPLIVAVKSENYTFKVDYTALPYGNQPTQNYGHLSFSQTPWGVYVGHTYLKPFDESFYIKETWSCFLRKMN